MGKSKNKLGFGLILLLTGLFFYKMFLGLVPIPVDGMVGAYFPWVDKKWGYSVGVPVKNIILSDVFSQLYPWRRLAVEQLKNLQLPLWNPYSFSGTPLLANWHSAPLYPLNLLMIVFGDSWGWSLMIVAQVLISGSWMYLFLKENKLGNIASLFGSVVFSFGGFMMIFLTVGTFGQAGAWVPGLLFLVLRYTKTEDIKYLAWLSLVMLLIVLAGGFQVATYGFSLTLIYFLFSVYKNKSGARMILSFLIFFILGVGLSCIYLIPVLELFGRSIREFDHNIVGYNYGLIPLKALITFFAPDYFGNPTTGNFRGFLYHETTFYFGIVALPFVVYGLIRKKRESIFFGLVAFLSLLLVLDTPVGQLVYKLGVPLLSTSYASRLNIILLLSVAVLAAIGLESVVKGERKGIFYSLVVVGVGLELFTWIGAIKMGWWFKEIWGEKYNISWRNAWFPLAFAMATSVSCLVLRKKRSALGVVLVGLLAVDLFRFGWKFTPFVPTRLDFPTTPLIEFMQNNLGVYRMERERAEILPPNTWMQYKMMSPSGYDPLYSLDYAKFYNVYNGSSPLQAPSRYAEPERPDLGGPDLVGVKYFAVIKRDEMGRVATGENGGVLPNAFRYDKFKEVFADGPSVVLENKNVWPRAVVYFDWQTETNLIVALGKLKDGFDFRHKIIVGKELVEIKPNEKQPIEAKITKYEPNQVIIEANGGTKGGVLFLSDSYYPGWEAKVNGRKIEIIRAYGAFRAVVVPAGQVEVVFEYKPKSFYLGAGIFGVCLLTVVSVLLKRSKGATRG